MPLVFGPDSSGFDDSPWMPEVLGEADGVFDGVTYHLYELGSGNSSRVPSECVNATYLNALAPRVRKHAETRATHLRVL